MPVGVYTRRAVLLLMCSMPLLFAAPAGVAEASGQRGTTVAWAGHKFREVTTVRDLPSSVQAALGVGRSGSMGIADRDGKYNPIDMMDRELPSRRFVVAGLDGDTALVAYEQGGIALRVNVVLYSNIGRKAAVQRTWTLSEVPRTLQALVDRLSRSH